MLYKSRDVHTAYVWEIAGVTVIRAWKVPALRAEGINNGVYCVLLESMCEYNTHEDCCDVMLVE